MLLEPLGLGVGFPKQPQTLVRLWAQEDRLKNLQVIAEEGLKPGQSAVARDWNSLDIKGRVASLV